MSQHTSHPWWQHSPTSTRALARLYERIAPKFRLVETPVLLPHTGIMYRMLRPATFDRLLTAVAGDPEQNLPYWATLWPSGIALADTVLQHKVELRDQAVLELGAGLGTTATAALAAGTLLTVTDYAPEALLMCRANTLRNLGAEPRTLQLNWRKPRPALFSSSPWPVVLAADVLYEARDVEPLLALVEQLVAPDGVVWLAEPGRPPAKRFIAAAQGRGWHDEPTEHQGPWPDPEDAGVVVHVHRLQRRAASRC